MKTLLRSVSHSRRHTLTLGYVLFALVASAWLAHSDSLFPAKQAGHATRTSGHNSASLFGDDRAFGVGDPLTVVIAENTSASSTADTKNSNTDSVNAFSGTSLFKNLLAGSLSTTNSRSGEGTGTTTRSGALTTTLAVLVKEVLPNGTLRIEGTRAVGVNRETQRVTFTGIVRPQDIAFDNSIQSNLIAEVEVHYDGKGVVGETQRMGLMSRLFRFLF